ncbi:hypothetical protein LUZ63_020601 [Rhynchospora breviuscula]|uniref:DNA-3-methyladenine glycosylase II n=1 Tax=Rhynchospora breviuscula TaxID=2022672 RepID=A0A9P9Z8L8_9POAL|nr:hypothetical protein LUZ63_020601 [Rhynchospora breviuscula]
MGGPFWARKDERAWTFPKGLPEEGEEPVRTACREYAEELGVPAPDPATTDFLDLGEVRQSGGKRVTAWAVEVDVDPADVVPGTFETQWPPRSGRTRTSACWTGCWSGWVADLDRVLLGPVEEVAPLLLGAHLTHAGVTVRLTEVEAYAGPAGQRGADDPGDPGSHSFRGPTPRTRSMHGPPGRLYTYFTYGMHWCANVVTGPEGQGSAVLLRAGEVVAGQDLARERRTAARRSTRPLAERDLARGPACLCRALALAGEQDGLDLAGHLVLGDPPDPGDVRTGPRVGLRLAAERPWRFWLADERTVSRYVPAPGSP